MRLAVLFVLASAAVPCRAAAPKLAPAPWTDGEMLWYASRVPETPTPAPTATPTATPASAGGVSSDVTRPVTPRVSPANLRIDIVSSERGALVLRSHWLRPGWTYYGPGLDLSLLNSEGRTIHADPDTLAPSTFVASDLSGEQRARYAQGKVEVVVRDGKATSYDLQDAAFDSSQLPFVLRRLPLGEGYVAAFSLFTARMGVHSARAEVVGRERVTVPAGTFECFKVRFLDGRSSAEQIFWVSTDEHRYVVREEHASAATSYASITGPHVFELIKIARWGEPTPVRLEDDRWNVALTLPKEWVAQPLRPAGKLGLALTAASLDGEVQCGMQLENFLLLLPQRPAAPPAGWRPEKPRVLAEREAKRRARAFRSYAVDPDGWSEPQVDGRPAARYRASFTPRQEGPPVVEYVTCLTQPVRAVLSCTAAPAVFDKRKPEMDELAASLRLR